MNQFLWLLGVFIAALLGGLISAAPIFVLPLMGSLLIALPLTIVVAGMFAGLAAAWTGSWLAPEGVRRNLARIVGLSEATAAVLSVFLMALLLWLEEQSTVTGNLFLVLLPMSAVVLAIAATLATWWSKAPASKASLDALATLGFMGLMGFVVMWTIGLGSLLSQFGL